MLFSGSTWVSQFPTSSSVDDLAEPFRSNVREFLGALKDSGARVSIADTLRPVERVYLMHWSFLIANGLVNPAKVPPMDGVDIQWVHTDSGGNPDLTATKTAAAEMVRAYGIVFAPALTSRHSQGMAIDMSISWQGQITIKDASGTPQTLRSLPSNGLNTDLHRLGSRYGVVKLVSDPPHWSSDGH
jgi:hypothetical protein